MVEIFVTDVTNESSAKHVLKELHTIFKDYSANFDLEDCDRILRVESSSAICHRSIIELLEKMQVNAAIYQEQQYK
ncbi:MULTISPECIES: hypothetical protein [Galbibacter]|uniref:Uncharacterized protein n=1 Tax=Galbibacter pacificus TaxID=2996052 RepID=A0ABT6FS73_9FLAO|nr:hypothetical protein [Galbibacter pacificus]MDG3582758.1 hypothetical protein [Galbibacter pacificus]MDG3586123.1 hypothetical protein [Galbibacter pacificus]